MKLHPWNEVIEQASKYMEQGHEVMQQFNCAHCGAKQTMGTPNRFYTRGLCEECGEETGIVKNGCNYMLVIGGRTTVERI